MENYVGKRLDGRYEIIEIIGVGGMAVVYKAYDNIDNRIVAVKILKDEYLTNEEFRRRFKNESRAIAVLSHPNIVKVYDVSNGDRLQYIVMEYVEGITLKEYIEQQGKIDLREAIYFVTQILRALQHAHDKGIVHRDIKPQNIMLISDGTIKVTDFGIARFSRSETKTMTDTAIGSVHYISPEQAKGSLTDAKTDIYSVGVVMYEMLTGKLPFQSDNVVSVALMQLQKDPIKPRELNPQIPIGLEQIVMRAMQKNPNDRYQSASEMLVDIDAYKRNPNIKFDYSYFVDKQPTKYIPNPQNLQQGPERMANDPQRPVVHRAPLQPTAQQRARQQRMAQQRAALLAERKRKRTIAMLSGIFAALILIAIVVVALVIPGRNKVDVPNLVGMNFEKDVMNHDEYSVFNFDPQPSTDDEVDEDPGTIVKQVPSKGKIERGGKITLFIVPSDDTKQVPDVYGYMYSSAQSILKSSGFEVKIKTTEDDSKEAGTVIRTDPARGEEVSPGSTVTLYVASGGQEEPVEVPYLIGKTIEEAEDLLKEAGLSLDSDRTEYRSNTAARGKIIGYEHLGEKVAPGTAIAVYVSTGEMPTTTTTTTETTTETTTQTTTATTTETTTAPSTTSSDSTSVSVSQTTTSESSSNDGPVLN